MARIEFYDGTSAYAHEAYVTVFNGNFVIRANNKAYTVQGADIQPTLSTPNGRRFIQLPQDMALEFHDNADAERLLDSLDAPHLRRMRWFDKNYRTPQFLLGAIAVFTGLVSSLYFFILPVASQAIANQLPEHLFDELSASTLKQMRKEALKPSKLSPQRQAQLLAQFNKLKKPQTDIPFKLHFYSAPDIGPNAFALPSGDVVLLDELVNITTTDQQTMGVLAHELGHVAHRHTMRGIVQNSIVSFAIAAWLGDYGSTSINLATSTVLNQKYSRDFESEADDYAIATLKLNHISPAVLADFFDIMEKQEASDGKKQESSNGWLDIIQSHPPTQERIQTLRDAAKTN